MPVRCDCFQELVGVDKTRFATAERERKQTYYNGRRWSSCHEGKGSVSRFAAFLQAYMKLQLKRIFLE